MAPHSVLRVNLPTPPANAQTSNSSQLRFTREEAVAGDVELQSSRSHSIHSLPSNEKQGTSASDLELDLPPRQPDSAPFTPFQADNAAPSGFYSIKEGQRDRRPSFIDSPKRTGRVVRVAMSKADAYEENNGMKRTLTQRHIQFIAFSGVRRPSQLLILPIVDETYRRSALDSSSEALRLSFRTDHSEPSFAMPSSLQSPTVLPFPSASSPLSLRWPAASLLILQGALASSSVISSVLSPRADGSIRPLASLRDGTPDTVVDTATCS